MSRPRHDPHRNRRTPPVASEWCRLALCLLVGLAGTGCESRVLWSYRDDPYLEDYRALGEAHCVGKLNSVYVDDRQVALRVLAHEAARARHQGHAEHADRLTRLILERFREDKHPEIKSCVVSICAPICGKGNQLVERFLRQCIARGPWAADAALSLAALRPEEGMALLGPLARHPSPPVRYRAALALTAIGDARAAGVVADVVQSMSRPAWPSTVNGVPLRRAREALAHRAERLWDPPEPGTPPGPRTDGRTP